MKRKVLLSTITLPALVISPFLYSCNKNIADYQVTQQEFEDAISLKNVELLQIDGKTYDGGEINDIEMFELSKNICHLTSIKTSPEPDYNERYVIMHDESEPPTYTKFERESPYVDFGAEETAREWEFQGIDVISSGFMEYYQKLGGYSSFSFNNDKKSYIATQIIYSIKLEAEFYFFKKKVVKFVWGYEENKQVAECKYDSIIPTPPYPH